MSNKLNILIRKYHYWVSAIVAVPLLIIILTGLILMLKKEFGWIQPPTIKGEGKIPTLSYEEMFKIIKGIPDANVSKWADIKKLDIRPSKGMIKVRCTNNTEVQIDHQSGKILSVAYRRSDIIESIHDGSFFHKNAKLLVFFPSGILLLFLWISGMYLFFIPFLRRKKKREFAKL